MSELINESLQAPKTLELVSNPTETQSLTVICYTPAGNPIEVKARDLEHAAWLKKMNPQYSQKQINLVEEQAKLLKTKLKNGVSS
jgi:hypothetical protein